MKLVGERKTRETQVTMKLETGGEPDVDIAWKHHGGLDEEVDEGLAGHLYTTLLRYARLGGSLSARGDLAHHVIEDTAITLGQVMGEHAAAGAIVRFADRTVAMDEAVVQVVLDAGGRAFYMSDLGEVTDLWDHALRAIAHEAKFTVHVITHRGADPHHIVEAAMKGLGMCLVDALATSERLESTKGKPTRGGRK